MSTIAHIYSDETASAGIAKQLTEAGFTPFVVSGKGPGGFMRPKEAIVADLKAQQFDHPIAEAYALALAKGGELVGVHPTFGKASQAIEIFDSVASVEIGIDREHATSAIDWTDATPISKAFGWPVLLDHNTSFSEYWRLAPLLTTSGPLFSWFGFPLLQEGSTPISKLLGLPVLSENATPLSSKLNIPTLS